MSGPLALAPPAPVELRIDPADGVAYDYNSFIMQYGLIDGNLRWAMAFPPAPPPPAPPSHLSPQAAMLTHLGHVAVAAVNQRVALTNAENAALALKSQQLQLQIDKTAAELDVYKEQTNQVRQLLSVTEKQEVLVESYLGSIESEQDEIERKKRAREVEARAARATRQRTQGTSVAEPQSSAGGAAAGGAASVLQGMVQGAVQFVFKLGFSITDPGSK